MLQQHFKIPIEHLEERERVEEKEHFKMQF